jgi:hypothetical protein
VRDDEEIDFWDRLVWLDRVAVLEDARYQKAQMQGS